MDLRDSIKTNIKTEQQVKEEMEKAELERIQKIKNSTIHSFQNHILGTSKEGVRGNCINGTYIIASLINSIPEVKTDGSIYFKKHKKLFPSIYHKAPVYCQTWKFNVYSPDMMIKINSITEYAQKEHINISFGVIKNSDTIPLKIDPSAFPCIKITGGPSFLLYSLRPNELSLCVHYSLTI